MHKNVFKLASPRPCGNSNSGQLIYARLVGNDIGSARICGVPGWGRLFLRLLLRLT